MASLEKQTVLFTDDADTAPTGSSSKRSPKTSAAGKVTRGNATLADGIGDTVWRVLWKAVARNVWAKHRAERALRRRLLKRLGLAHAEIRRLRDLQR